MRDTRELYRHLLGLASPWTVQSVQLSEAAQRVDVWVEHPVGYLWKCPRCEASGSLHDHSDERTWRHLDSCHFGTYLHARVPRMRCPTHGVVQVTVPWAEPHSRFTLLCESQLVATLKQSTVEGTATLFRLQWGEVMRVMQRAVERGLQRQKQEPLPKRLGIDEKYTSCGVLTLVNDLDHKRVYKVLVGTKKEPLKEYLESFPLPQREAVIAVAMDLSDTFYGAVAAAIPDSQDKIVYDRFHVMQLVTRSVNQVREAENAELLRQGDTRLKGTRYLWGYSAENVPSDQRERLEQLKAGVLKTGRAFALKDFLRTLWTCPTRQEATQVFFKWARWAQRSRLEPMIDLARRLHTRLSNIPTFVEHRVTNALSEGINSALSTLLRRAYGNRNLQNQITAIYFHQGRLNLLPELASHGNWG